MSLSATIMPREGLAPSDVDRMYALFERYFVGTTRHRFEQDLSEKDDVILLSDGAGCIQGFSTVKVIENGAPNADGRAIFSGDTIVDRACWGEFSLAQAFIRLAAHKKAESPDRPLYWFLIVMGHRTFRYLPLFFKSFYPNWIRPTPYRLQAVMDSLAGERFGTCYDHNSGTIRFPVPSCRLTDSIADIPAKDVNRREVQFFLERNPGFRRGDELVCLAEITEDNLLPFARRGFVRGMAP